MWYRDSALRILWEAKARSGQIREKKKRNSKNKMHIATYNIRSTAEKLYELEEE